MKDLWTSEKFEKEITAATVALYESEIDQECVQNSIARFDAGRFMTMRKHGVYIVAPDREVLAPEHGMSVLKWPVTGCISLGSQYKAEGDGQPEDLLESYCRLVYFRRLERLPSHSSMVAVGDPYEMIMAWPQDKGPVSGITDYLTVNRRTGKVTCTVPSWEAKDPGKVSRRVHDEERKKISDTLSAAIQFVDDARHMWSITAHNDVSRVTVGAHAESIKSLLYARNLPVTKTGRKRPILHIVHAHRRRISAGTDVDVRDFLRGTREIVMNNTKYSVSAPNALIEELRLKVAP